MISRSCAQKYVHTKAVVEGTCKGLPALASRASGLFLTHPMADVRLETTGGCKDGLPVSSPLNVGVLSGEQ